MSKKIKHIPKPKLSLISATEKAAIKFKEAYALHQIGRLSDAQELYEEILGSNPKHFDALHLLGVILTETNPQRAVDLISSAIEINPTLPESFVNAANALVKLDQYEVAMNCCHQAIAMKTDNWKAHYNLALCLLKLKRGSEALDSYDRALTLSSNGERVYLGRGAAYEAQYKFSAALQDYDKAIELKPDYADAHTNRGNALMQMGFFEEASHSHDRAIHLSPDFADAHMNKAILLLMMGNLESGWGGI
jgi:tetratricopeptide (TPR) repeat protein